MTAASSITRTGTDTATMPFSRPISSVGSSVSSVSPPSVRTVVPRARLERTGYGAENDTAPVENASGARLLIPAVSLRKALAEPTRASRIQSLHEVSAFTPPELPEPTSSSFVGSIPSAPRPSVAEATVPAVRRPFRLRIGKATAVASAVGGLFLLLGLAFSTTDAAATVASRIHMAFEGDDIPAAAADPAPPSAVLSQAVAEPPAAIEAPEAPVVDLELPATPPQHAAPRAHARPARMARPAPLPMPIRLRSPY